MPANSRRSDTTSLDAGRSSVEVPHLDNDSANFIFEKYPEERARILRLCHKLATTQAQAQRMRECGSRCTVLYCPRLERFKLNLTTCGSRLCPHCRIAYKAKLASKILGSIGRIEKNQWKFITLTLEHSAHKLPIQLDHLRRSFRRLRQQTIWKRCATYGHAIIEVEFNEKSQRWHPHLHVLVKTKFMPQAKLSDAWSRASFGSVIIDIRAIDSGRMAASYASKYVGKAPDLSNAEDSDKRFLEYAAAIKHRKLLITFGDHPNVPCVEPTGQDDTQAWEWWTVAAITDVRSDASQGDLLAVWILESLANHGVPTRAPPRPLVFQR